MKMFAMVLTAVFGLSAHAANSQQVTCTLKKGGPQGYSQNTLIDRAAMAEAQPGLPYLTGNLTVNDVELTILVEVRSNKLTNLRVIAKIPEFGVKRISASGRGQAAALTIYPDATSASRDIWCQIR